jgi:hypothetical protein
MDGVEVFLDGKSIGVVDKGKSRTLPGLTPGAHTVTGVKMGYEPDGPREETVYPGRDTTVSIKIMIARHRSRAASDALDKGLEFYKKGYEQNRRRVPKRSAPGFRLQPGGPLSSARLQCFVR